MKVNDEIIDKVLNHTASEAERQTVKSWFATDEGQIYLSERINAEASQIGEKEIRQWTGGDIPTERMKTRFLTHIYRPKRSYHWLKIAAVTIPILLLSSFSLFLAKRTGVFTPPQYAEIVVPYGERIQVVLQDGTIVELNSGTTLRYPKQFGLFSREVELRGEGYFTVAKESDRPFTVQAEGLNVVVTGTQFNIKAYPEDNYVFVSLNEGEVLLNAKYPLKTGESATYNCCSGELEITNTKDPESIEAWRTNSMNFYLTPLKEIIKVLERQYNVQFIINNPTLLEYRYTLSTSKVNVRDVLQDLETVSYIEFIECGDNIFEIKNDEGKGSLR